MKPENKELLITGAAELGVRLGEGECALVDAYLAVLDKWAAKMNLTAVRGERERVVKLVLDSLAATPLLSEGIRVADAGSGAGLPGVPVKIARPDLTMTLIESRRKRADFLAEVTRRLGLPGMAVFLGRAEDYAGPAFDAALVRAVGSVGEIATLCGKLLKKGGRVLAMKGATPEDEIREAEQALAKAGFRVREIRRYQLPASAGERGIVVLEKT